MKTNKIYRVLQSEKRLTFALIKRLSVVLPW